MMARLGAITNMNDIKKDDRCPIKTGSLLSLVVIGTLCIEIFCCAEPAQAQFAIQPMVLSLKAKPGAEIKTGIRLQNLQQDPRQPSPTFEIQPIELIQSLDGQWLPISPTSLDYGAPACPPNHASCCPWIYPKLGICDTSDAEFYDVTVNVPSDTQGFYCAALSVKISELREPPPAVGTDYEFTVPVMVEVQGPALGHAVQLKGAGLEQDTGTPAPATLVTLEVENRGRTFSQLTGFVHIYAYRGDELGPIKHKITFDEVNIIPGAKLKLKKALPKLLPGGRYRVLADLSVDNRLVAGISRDIELTEESSKLQALTDPPIAALSKIERLRNSKAGNDVTQYLQVASEPGAFISRTVHYAIRSPDPTVAIMKQKPVRVSQDATAHDPYNTYSGSTPIEFLTNTPVCLRTSAVATSRAEGNWTCAMDPASICGHMSSALFVVATDVQLKNLPGGRATNLEVARVAVVVIPRL